MKPKKVVCPRGIIEPPGVLVPSFYVDPKTKVYGCYARPWTDILVDELEEKMRGQAEVLPWEKYLKTVNGDAFKQEYLGSFLPIDSIGAPTGRHVHYARRDATASHRIYNSLRHMTRNMPSPRYAGKKPAQIIIHDDFYPHRTKPYLEADFASIEMRILAQMSPEDRELAGLGGLNYTIIKNRNPEGTCKPTIRPLIFQPSLPTSPDSEPKDSVTRRLLVDSVLKRPPSTSA